MSGVKRPAQVHYDTGFTAQVQRSQQAADLLRSQEAERQRNAIEQQQRMVAERRIADLERRIGQERAVAQQERLEMQRSIEQTARQIGVVSERMERSLRAVDERMTAKLGEISSALKANTELLQENRRVMARGFDDVMQSIRDEAQRSDVRSMREAADLIDEVLERRSEMSPRDISEAAPEHYQQLERTLAGARNGFREGNFALATNLARTALDVAVETAVKVAGYAKARRQALSEASARLAEVQTQLEWLGSKHPIAGEDQDIRSVGELVDLWTPGEREDLGAALSQALNRPLHELTLPELEKLTPTLSGLRARAAEIEAKVRTRISQHEMRSRLLDALCEAMGKELFALDDIRFEREDDPSSDLLIRAANGPTVRIPINCDERHFQIENNADPVANRRDAERIFAGLRKHGIEAAGFDVIRP